MMVNLRETETISGSDWLDTDIWCKRGLRFRLKICFVSVLYLSRFLTAYSSLPPNSMPTTCLTLFISF